MQLVERWWNGQWGMARLDVWLYRDGERWLVRAQKRLGQWGEGERWFDSEEEARASVDHLLRTAKVGGDRWRDIA